MKPRLFLVDYQVYFTDKINPCSTSFIKTFTIKNSCSRVYLFKFIKPPYKYFFDLKHFIVFSRKRLLKCKKADLHPHQINLADQSRTTYILLHISPTTTHLHSTGSGQKLYVHIVRSTTVQRACRVINECRAIN